METLKILFLASHWRVSLVKAFQDAKPPIEPICADSDPLSPSLRQADHSEVIPLFSDPQCLKAVLELCETANVCALVPLTNKSIEFIAQHRNELQAENRRLWIPDDRAIDICHDKWKLFEFLSNEGFETPPTFLAGKTGVPFPLIAKPRRGEGSKNLFVIEDIDELKYYTHKCPDHVFQKRITGQEFSVDVFCGKEGEPGLVVPRERLAVRGGEVMVSRINMDKKIIERVQALVAKLGLTGPCTIQGFKDGELFYFTDVNLRFGSGYVHTINAGGNVPLMMYKELTGQEFDSENLDIKDQSVMTRYPESVFHH